MEFSQIGFHSEHARLFCGQRKSAPTAFMEANYAVNSNSMSYSTDCKMAIASYTAQLKAELCRTLKTVEQRLSMHPKARTEGQ